MIKSITTMNLPRLPAKASPAVALASIILAGIFFHPSSTATAQTTADLAISIYNTPLDVYTNDYMPYTMYVTNLGPGTVASVVVTNAMPSGFSLIGASPAYTLSGTNLIFSLGSLTNLQVVKLLVSAEPNSSGIYAFSTSVSSASNTDTNTVNNAAMFNVSVGNYLAGNLTASLVSTQFTDFQLGLEGQFIQISNNGTVSIPSARVVVTGLSKQLWTAAGTNNGNPFVIYGSPLAPGQSADLLLEFGPHGSFTFSGSQLQAIATPLATLSPPGDLGPAMGVPQEFRVGSGSPYPGAVLLIWPCANNQSYTILYSDNPEFANPLFSPAIVPSSGANYLEWMDYGPPVTIGFPTNTSQRFYRLYQNP